MAHLSNIKRKSKRNRISCLVRIWLSVLSSSLQLALLAYCVCPPRLGEAHQAESRDQTMHPHIVASSTFALAGLSTSRGAIAPTHTKSVRNVRVGDLVSRAYKVEIEHQGKVTEMEVDEDTTILEAAEESGLVLPHDCRLGVCMTCPAKLVEGNVDQSGSMLSEDVAEKGYALLCVSRPESDCKFKTIAEEEVLDLQLMTSQF